MATVARGAFSDPNYRLLEQWGRVAPPVGCQTSIASVRKEGPAVSLAPSGPVVSLGAGARTRSSAGAAFSEYNG